MQSNKLVNEMKQIYFATKNKGKVNSVNYSLSKYGINVVHYELELPEPRTYDLQEIAIGKAKYAYNIIQKPCIAMDAGFFLKAYNGFPRTYVNFALETIGIKGILKLVEGENRACEFNDVIAYYDGKESFVLERIVEGSVSLTPRGEKKHFHWSELCKIFVPKGLDITLGEMDYDYYLKWKATLKDDTYQRLADMLLKKIIN